VNHIATKILLLDDNSMFRSALRALLESKDEFEVVGEATDGDEALRLLAAGPDVVITDRYLPGADGLEVTRQIKQQRPEVAVLLLSGFQDSTLAALAADAGAAAVLNKGKSLGDLVPTIRAIAAEQRARSVVTTPFIA
jgi:DNA-binding NarL/FixJ family response regulator